MIPEVYLRNILSTACLLTLGGNALIWVQAYENFSGLDGIYAFFLVFISCLNYASFEMSKPVLQEVASLFMLATIYNPMCKAQNSRTQDESTLLTGYIISISGVFLSFIIHIPQMSASAVKENVPKFCLKAFPSLLMITGVFSFWAFENACSGTFSFFNQSLWFAMYNVITLFTNNQEGQNIIFFWANFMLLPFIPNPASCNGDKICKGSVSTMFTAYLLVIVIRITYSIQEAGPAEVVLKIKANGYRIIKEHKGHLLALLVCASLLGSILIWAGKDKVLPTALECYLVFLVVCVVLLEFFAYLTENKLMVIAALSIMAACVSPAITYLDTNRIQQERAGYIMLIISALVTLAFPIDLASAKSAARDPGYRGRVIIGLALLVATLMLRQSYQFLIGYVGLLATVSAMSNFKEGEIVSFYLCCNLIPGLTPFSTGDSNKEAYMLAFLAVLALLFSFVETYQIAEPLETLYEKQPLKGDTVVGGGSSAGSGANDASTTKISAGGPSAAGYGSVDDAGVTSLA